MNKMNAIILLLFIALFSSSYTFQLVSCYGDSDFCVANLLTPYTSSGYECNCKPPKDVTVDDFVFSGFVSRKPINPFNIRLTVASVNNLPGLNGLDVSAARVDVGVNGTIAMHFHPHASELFIMVQGQLKAGFVTPPNRVFVKDIKPGDVMVFPEGVVHFVVNSGDTVAVAFATYTTSNPSFHFLDHLLFANELPTSIISQSSFLDFSQITKLKTLFGGSG